MLATYVLTYVGSGEKPEDVAARMAGEQGEIRLVERIGDSLIVEGDRSDISALIKRLSGWFGSPERRVRHPRPRSAATDR